MGVVYLATDTRLDRQVAIKALPPELASDPARLERFEREAKTLASLNHPNLAGIHGVEEQDGAKYLVLEYVEGVTLADRLDRGPLPVDEAIELAVQIAAGIEAAHEAGVVHRDLKPANIIVTPDGQAKVLDFGLARTDDGGQSSTGALDSPTMTTPQNSPTIAGAILGTAAYMSPEQARGRRVDKRTDIWSFGVLLYEMLVGASPFHGETATDSIGAVLHKDLDLALLPRETPINVRRVLERCLVRDKNLRYRDIGDVRVELLQPDGVQELEPEQVQESRGLLWAAILGTAVVVAAIAGAAGWFASQRSILEPQRVVQRIDVLRSSGSAGPWTFGPAISPDGRQIAFIRDEQIHLRPLNQFESAPLPGTEGASNLFWSPDSRSLGFRTSEGVFAIFGLAGRPVRVSELDVQYGLVWTDDGRIIANIDGTLDANIDSRLVAFPERGGEAETVIKADDEVTIDYHEFFVIPGTGVLVYFEHLQNGDMPLVAYDGERAITLAAFDDVFNSTCVWSPTGHVLFTRGVKNLKDLWAVKFSPQRMETEGEPFLVMSDVTGPSVSNDGTLAVVRGNGKQSWGGEIGWITTDGEFELITEADESVAGLLPSPDGSMLAFTSGPIQSQADVWVHDFDRGFSRRIQKFSGFGFPVAWSPDSSELLVVEVQLTEGMRFTTHFLAADGSGDSRESYDGFVLGVDPTWTTAAVADGDLRNPFTASLAAIRLDDYSSLGVVVEKPRVFGSGVSISPDGSYALYASSRSGRGEVYCIEWPSGDGTQQVSTEGGRFAVWSSDGSRIIFQDWEGEAYYEVDVERTPALSLSRPRPLFAEGIDTKNLDELQPWKEEGRFITIRRGADEADAQPLFISIIENWYEEFRKPSR